MRSTPASRQAASKPPVDLAPLINALADCQGQSRGLCADALAARCGWSLRKLRKHISAARLRGYHICGHPKVGYWMAVTAEELQMATRFLERRALHSLLMLSRMRGVAMPALLGQMQLVES